MARLLNGLPLSGLKTKPPLDGNEDRMYVFCPKQIFKKKKNIKNLNKLIFNVNYFIIIKKKSKKEVILEVLF
tara:strand:- start:3664 stop:3879 length:216 start_codon:yes stop_codon:yes gene_type:complete